MTFDDFRTLIGQSLRDPDGAARTLIAQNWPVSARWMALVAAVSVSAVLAWIATVIFSPSSAAGAAGGGALLMRQPMILAALQMGAILLGAGLMTSVGRLFGGTGRFEDALLLTVWIEVLLLVVQIAQLVLALVTPTMAGIVSIAALVMFLWLTVHFTRALHGFRSGFKVFLGVLGTIILAGFVLSLLAASLGLIPEVAP